MKHLPGATGVTVVPSTVQILNVLLVKVIIEPAALLLISLTAAVLPEATNPVGGVKEIVCVILARAVTVTVYVSVVVPSRAVTTVRITFAPILRAPLKAVVPVAPKY